MHLNLNCLDGTWFAIRPSGTEPKIKFYFGVKGETKVESDELLLALKAAVMTIVERLTSESKLVKDKI